MSGGVVKLALATIVALAALVGVGKLAGFDFGLGDGGREGLDGAEVRRGDLRISVVERANLEAAKSAKLKCELEGRTTILWLIPEGTLVEQGDVVCELDTSAQVEQRVSQEIAVQNALASFAKSEAALDIQKSQNLSDIKRAEQDLEFARQDQVKYLEGELPQLLQDADEEILLAEEDLKRKQNVLEWSRRLAEKDFLTRTELEADEFAFNSAKVTLEQRRRAKMLLEDFDAPRRKLELAAAIEEAERELERVKLQAEARLADFVADHASSKAKLELEQEELRKLNDEIAKAVMRAPVAGMVVYAKEEGGRWGGGDPIQEGTEVRERQEIITIPSSEGMVAEMKLHESVLEKVREGQICILKVDAVPGRTYAGRVRFKSTLPDQNAWWSNPDLRVYRTEVDVLDGGPELKSGMSCSVEVVVDDLEDVLHVPVQTVFLNRGKPSCFVSDEGAIALREVEVGQDNGKWVEILSGLSEGETVLLAQPAGFTLEPALSEKAPLPEVPPMEPPQGRERGGPAWEGGERRGGPDAPGAPGARGERGEHPPGGGAPGGAGASEGPSESGASGGERSKDGSGAGSGSGPSRAEAPATAGAPARAEGEAASALGDAGRE